MFDHVQLRSLISAAKATIRKPATIIKTPAELKEAVDRQDFLNEVKKLSSLLSFISDEQSLLDSEENNEAALKRQFARLCLERDKQNRGTLLHFVTAPESPCNQLYFEITKVLYPESTCLQICTHLFPTLKNVWQLKTRLSASGVRPRRIELSLDLKEVPIDSEEVSDYLGSVAEHPSLFKRILLLGNSLFALEEIAGFDFKNHCKFHQLLMEKALPLKQGLVLHNEAFAELYNTIEQLQGEGGSLHEFFLSAIKHMEGSGEYFGSVEFAKDEGSDAAHRLYKYYESLPGDVKDALSKCQNSTGDTFLKLVKEIEKGECIETVVRLLNEILINPANQKVLSIRPYLTREQNEVLAQQYVHGRRRGEPLVALDGKFNTTTWPENLVRPFYRMVFFEDPHEIASYLIDFQPDQYALLLSEATIDIQDVEYSLEGIWPLLNETQYLAFIRAMGSNPDKFNVQLLLSFCIHKKDIQGIQVLLECVSPEDRLCVLIDEDDAVGLSLFSCASEDLECICMMLSCLPNSDRLTPLFKTYDELPLLNTIARNRVSLARVMGVLVEDDRISVIRRVLRILNQDECERLQSDPDIRACFVDVQLRIFDRLLSDKMATFEIFGFGFFDRSLSPCSELMQLEEDSEKQETDSDSDADADTDTVNGSELVDDDFLEDDFVGGFSEPEDEDGELSEVVIGF